MKYKLRWMGVMTVLSGCGVGPGGYQPGLRSSETDPPIVMEASDFEPNLLIGSWSSDCLKDPVSGLSFGRHSAEFTSSGEFKMASVYYGEADCVSGSEIETHELQGTYTIVPRMSVDLSVRKFYVSFPRADVARQVSGEDPPRCGNRNWIAGREYDVSATSCNKGRESLKPVTLDRDRLVLRRYYRDGFAQKSVDTQFFRR